MYVTKNKQTLQWIDDFIEKLLSNKTTGIQQPVVKAIPLAKPIALDVKIKNMGHAVI